MLLCAGVLPEGRREEITRVTLNAHVVGAINIERTKQDANPYPSGGTRLQGPDGPYWSHYPMTIPLGAFLMFFKVTIPEPGEYEVVLTLQSPDFRDKGDHFYRGTLTARATGNAMSDPDVRDQLRRLYADDVATVEGLLGFADRLFARLELLARKQDGIVGAEVARATKMLRAGLLLCENGYGEQAAMVCRDVGRRVPPHRPQHPRASDRHSGSVEDRGASPRAVDVLRRRAPDEQPAPAQHDNGGARDDRPRRKRGRGRLQLWTLTGDGRTGPLLLVLHLHPDPGAALRGVQAARIRRIPGDR